MRRCWRREEVQESQGSRVPRSRGPKVLGSLGPRYLKLTFKYELDSKEGPSCLKIQIIHKKDDYNILMSKKLHNLCSFINGCISKMVFKCFPEKLFKLDCLESCNIVNCYENEVHTD